MTKPITFELKPGKGDGCPVDDLEEGDEAESKAKSKEAAHQGDELNRTHADSPLHLCKSNLRARRKTQLYVHI